MHKFVKLGILRYENVYEIQKHILIENQGNVRIDVRPCISNHENMITKLHSIQDHEMFKKYLFGNPRVIAF